jgi:hypothetical protein
MHRAQVPAVALLASVLLASASPIHAAPQAKEADL